MRVASPKRELRHQQILTAALRVFSRDGFDGASVAAIAEEAGIAKGSVYLYFDSKEALAGDLVRHVFTLHGSAELPSRLERPLTRIVDFCDQQEKRVLSLGEFAPIVLHMIGHVGKSENTHIGRGVRQVMSESAFYLSTLLDSARRAGDLPRSTSVEAVGRTLVAICYGLIQHRLTLEQAHASRVENCQDVLRTYLRGLGARI